MNGAESVVRTLVAGGVNTCFTNPGTSEIHFVAAMARAGALRGVPCLFEGVAVGAADGYARMTARPAATLLHLGPGLANGLANLHNARRARAPMINIVGDHASFHRRHDAPLTSDIEAIARPYSAWLRTTLSAADAGQDCAEAIAAALAPPGQIATLILPADAAWNDGGRSGRIPEFGEAPRADAAAIARAIAMLKNGKPTAILLGGRAAQGEALRLAGRIAAATNAKLLSPFAFARMERGAGRPNVERIAYVTEQALEQLGCFAQIILVGAPAPVAFFAHPTKPSVLAPEACELHTLTSPTENAREALRELADALAPPQPALATPARPAPPTGEITLGGLAAAVGALLPEHAIVVDESITSGRGMLAATRDAPPHDWLVNTGGSIGIEIPLAVGAAIACPERAVLCLSGDGSAMYTLQALWTAAREQLRTTVVVFANRSYAILKGELAGQTDARQGALYNALLDIGRPDLDFTGLARAMGVPAKRVTTLDEFGRALQAGFASRGPNLIEVPL